MKNLVAENSVTLKETFSKFIEMVSDVPFGNSDYQNRQAIVNDEQTPMRAYRHAALRITNRLQALMEARYSVMKADVEIRKLKRRLLTESDDLERDLLHIEIEQKQATIPYTEKLVSDAIAEIESLYPVIEKLGAVKRSDFEAEESEHFRLNFAASGKALLDANRPDLYEAITGLPKVSLSTNSTALRSEGNKYG